MSNLTDEEKDELIKAFEEMLKEDIKKIEDEDDENDFGFFYPNLNDPEEFSLFPNTKDLEYPDTPPPIPGCNKKCNKECVKKCTNKCDHKETKKVYYSNTKAYIMCVKCKADLGDAK